MKPVIALIGRPNVGKSTLFNVITRTRDALVADFPGLTRDRQYGVGQYNDDEGNEHRFIVVDTGGLSGQAEELDGRMAEQTHLAIEESDVVLLLLDAREGITAADEMIAAQLRLTGKKIIPVLNKTDGLNPLQSESDSYSLGMGDPVLIAASHRRGTQNLLEAIYQNLDLEKFEGDDQEDIKGIAIAIVGRPNVGKSTLVNRLVGEERVVAFDQPGTTRDSICVPFERNGNPYTLIDTAGVRRRGKVTETVEKFSIIKTLDAIEKANIVVLVLDAQQGLADQDMSLLGHIIDSGRGLVVALNKWDGLTQEVRDENKRELDRRLHFLDFADIHFISAKHGTGVGLVMESVDVAYRSARRDMSTPRLTELLEEALFRHQPPMVRGRRVKLRYAHQGGQNPPMIIIHGNQTDSVPLSYKKYLSNFFIKKLQLKGTPLRIEFRTSNNPFKGRRNKLTPGQQKQRRRMMKHVKKQR
ncbi:MAG: ribosome biogenesis GTPase Der [Gammaproteobacteria bacterium]|nr:ribosome biogenesis GTPase Der [Gammaproteobacteria bacterium]